jgi:hypothetical protein
MSHFPVESGKTASFAGRGRLTGGLTDVGTDRALHRIVIRLIGLPVSAQGLQRIAEIAPG